MQQGARIVQDWRDAKRSHRIVPFFVPDSVPAPARTGLGPVGGLRAAATMSAASAEFIGHCLELLSVVGSPRARRMFGGHGLYVDDLFVALVIGERLYLKTDPQTRPQFEAAGCEPFVYDAAGKQVSVAYFSAPDDAMESPPQMQPWARLALSAALRARAAKPSAARPVSRARARKGPASKAPAKL